MSDAPRQAHQLLRMKELCERTGLNRQTVHFYIREGLLPAGDKTSRNMAWYTEEHVERLLRIKRLQHERFLPLDAIRALLDEREERFDPEQQVFLRELRARLSLDEVGGRPVHADELAAAGRVELRDVERLAGIGLAGVGRDEDGQLRVSGEAVPIVEVLGQLRALGFTEERGFQAEDVLIYERLVTDLLRAEADLVARGLAGLPPEEAAARISQALPLVHELIARLHTARIEQFLEAF